MKIQDLVTFVLQLKIARYGVIGGISTLVHLGVASAVIYYLTPSLLISNTLGFLVAFLFSYTMQSRLVFNHALSWRKAARYFLIQFGALLISIGISNTFPYDSYIKTFLVIVFMPMVTYLFHKFWTFKE